MKFEFFIPGEPRGKERPRGTKNGVYYTPSKTRSYEKHIRECFYRAYPKHKPIGADVPVSVNITALFKIPERLRTKANIKKIAEGKLFPTKKPDCDNIAKAALDGLNGLAYKDDKQVILCSVNKQYTIDGIGGIFVTIWEGVKEIE